MIPDIAVFITIILFLYQSLEDDGLIIMAGILEDPLCEDELLVATQAVDDRVLKGTVLTLFILDTVNTVGSLASSEDPNEMPEKMAFHQGSVAFHRGSIGPEKEILFA